jgi:Rrf2 family protein
MIQGGHGLPGTATEKAFSRKRGVRSGDVHGKRSADRPSGLFENLSRFCNPDLTRCKARDNLYPTAWEFNDLRRVPVPMKLSRKSDYALRALMTLVGHGGKGPISVREIAARNDIPPKFLENIMLEMKAQGWVASVPGRDGGFVLARSPDEITMGQVVRYFDGILAPISCVSTSHYEPCSQEGVCRFRRVLLDVRNYIARMMDTATLSSVFAGPVVRREEVFTPAMMYGEGI